MAEKTYLSDKPSLSVTFKGGKDENGEPTFETIYFQAGKHTTESEHEQKAIEASSLFASQHIRIAPDQRAGLVAAVAATGKAAATANLAAKAAKDALAAFDKPAAAGAAAQTAAA